MKPAAIAARLDENDGRPLGVVGGPAGSVEPRDELSALRLVAAERSRSVLASAVMAIRELLGMDAAYLAAFTGDEQIYVRLDGDLPIGIHEGLALPAAETLCRRVLDGAAPGVIPDTKIEPGVSDLAAVQAGLVGSYIGVPVTFSDDNLYGTLCCMSEGKAPGLDDRDMKLMSVVARIVADYLEREQTIAQDEARRQRELDRVVHDVRSPLQAIIGYAGLLSGNSGRQEHAATIANEAQRLNEMLGDLLTARARGHMRFDLREVIREQFTVFEGQSSRHRLLLDLPDVELEISGDRSAISSVIANLLSNAIKYSPNGGSVRTTAALDASRVRISVTDEGIGIPEKQAPGLFTRFFRVETDATHGIPGTGLGLALSRDVVRSHGGDISFHSNENGSTFRVELPRATS